LGLTLWTLAKWHQKHDSIEGQGAGNPKRESSAVEVTDCAALKQEIERLGPRSPSRRFPTELKARVARWVRGELARGVGTKVVAEQIGIPWETLSRWLGRRTEPHATVPKVRPVRLVANALTVGQKGPVLKSPGGFIVEGLDVPTLVEVLRQLG
jgi:hypothetical protein